MTFQLHVAGDIGAQWSCCMRECRAAEPGMKFLGNCGAAHLRTTFEHQRFEPGLGEVEGRDQAVVSATDDDDVARFGHASRTASFPWTFLGISLGASLCTFSRTSSRLSIFQNFERG